MVRLRFLTLLGLFTFALLVPQLAHADTAETRAKTLLRDHPNASGKVVDRLAAAAKVTLIEMNDDGSWAHVRTSGGHEGWVPVASIKMRGAPARDSGGDGDSGGGSGSGSGGTDDDAALAKRRNVRPEAWVSKSKYHDDDNKMTVVATKAELYGRPQAGGTVLGLVRRGEVVTFIRRSSDKKWVQIDMGAGELAWVDARAVRSGADVQEPNPDVPEEARNRDRDRRDRDRDRDRDDQQPSPGDVRHDAQAHDDRDVDRDRDRKDREARDRKDRDDRDRKDREARDRKDRDDRDRKDRDDRDRKDRDDRDRKDRDDRDRKDRDRDRGSDRDRDDRDHDDRRDRDRRDRDRDDRDRRDRDRRDRDRDDRDRRNSDEEPITYRPTPAEHGNNYFNVNVKFGFAKVGEQVRTNGVSTSLLRDYQFTTTSLAIGLNLGYTHAWGKLHLNIDLKYLAALAGSVVYKSGDTQEQLEILDQNIGGGIAIGGFWDVAGGLDLRLRVGADVWINQISNSAPPVAASHNDVLGMVIGLEFAMPAPLYIARRPMGFRLRLGALAPATRLQQPNLETTPHNTTLGGYAGGAIFFGLLREPRKTGELHIELAYDFNFAFSHFTGNCPPAGGATACRDNTVTDANYTSSAHVGTIGLYYQY